MGCFVSCRISFSIDKHVARSLCHSRATCSTHWCWRCRGGSYADARRGQSLPTFLADAVEGGEWRGCTRRVPRSDDATHQTHSQHGHHDVNVRSRHLPVSAPWILSWRSTAHGSVPLGSSSTSRGLRRGSGKILSVVCSDMQFLT